MFARARFRAEEDPRPAPCFKMPAPARFELSLGDRAPDEDSRDKDGACGAPFIPSCAAPTSPPGTSPGSGNRASPCAAKRPASRARASTWLNARTASTGNSAPDCTAGMRARPLTLRCTIPGDCTSAPETPAPPAAAAAMAPATPALTSALAPLVSAVTRREPGPVSAAGKVS